MDQANFYKGRMDQIHKTAREAVLVAKTNVEFTHVTAQFVYQLSNLCDEMDEAHIRLLEHRKAAIGLVSLKDRIEIDLEMIGDALVNKHSPGPKSPATLTMREAVYIVLILTS